MRFSKEELEKLKELSKDFEEYLKATERLAKEKSEVNRCLGCFFFICRCKEGLKNKK